jgi:hypothetical protein
MVRFTQEQIRFGKAMGLMFGIYQQLKALELWKLSLGDQSAPWFSKSLVRQVAEMLHLIIPNFSPSLYFQQYSCFRYRGTNDVISVTSGALLNFIGAMDALKEDVSRKTLDDQKEDGSEKGQSRICFRIDEIVVESHKKLEVEERRHGRRQADNKGGKKSKRLKFSIVPALNHAVAPLSEETAYRELYNMHLNDPPSSYDSFVLGSRDSSLFDFVTTNYNLFEAEGGGWKIFSPGYSQRETSIFEVAVYILIKYQWLFGSFDRIKKCRQCENLIFEKRLGTREFCGGTCRKRYNDSLQPPEKRLCRERQNAWISRRLNTKKDRGITIVYRLQKDDCSECTGQLRAGECPILRRKNSKAFRILGRYS